MSLPAWTYYIPRQVRVALVGNLWELNSFCPNSRTHRNVIGSASSLSLSIASRRHGSATLGEFETGEALGSFVTPDVVDLAKPRWSYNRHFN